MNLLETSWKHLVYFLCGALILCCFTSPSPAESPHDSLTNEGKVAQSVVSFHLPGGRPALAVVFAFSDSVEIYTKGPGANYRIKQTLPVGMHPGPANDLPRDLIAHDVNHDGFTDLIILCSGNPNLSTPGSLQVLEGRPDGAFLPHHPFPTLPPSQDSTHQVLRFPVTLVKANLDRDHFTDLAVGYGECSGVGFFRGGETGRFTFEKEIIWGNDTSGAPALALWDMDGDGKDDLLAGTGNQLIVTRRTGDFTFGFPRKFQMAPDAVASSMALADLNHDSSIDVIIGDSNGAIYIFPDFQFLTSSIPTPICLGGLGNAPSQGVSDVCTLDWNMDSYPEIAAVNRLDDNVTIISPSHLFPPIKLPTDHAPRRIARCDLNADGSPDLVTANEGDLAMAENPDLTFLINPHKPLKSFPLHPVKRISLPKAFPLNIDKLAGAAYVTNAGYIAADVGNGKLVSIGGNGEILNAHDFPFLVEGDVAGLAWNRNNSGNEISLYMATRRLCRIFEVKNGSILETVSIERPHGGISALAYDKTRDSFWILAPHLRELWIVDRNGNHLWKASLPLGYTRMAVDFMTRMVYLGDPSLNRVDVFHKSGWRLIPKSSYHLAELSPLLYRSGVSALAWNPQEYLLGIFTTDHIYIETSPFGYAEIRDGPRSLSRGTDIASLTIDPQTGRVYVLDRDGIPSIIILDANGRIQSVHTLRRLLEQNENLHPSMLAFGHDINRDNSLLITDGLTPNFHLFNPSSEDSALADYAINWTADSSWQPLTGFDIHKRSGAILMRNRRGLLWAWPDGTVNVSNHFDGHDPGDVSATSDYIFSLAPKALRVDKTGIDGKPAGYSFIGSYYTRDKPGSLAISEEHRLVYIGAQETGEILVLKEGKKSKADPSWNCYE